VVDNVCVAAFPQKVKPIAIVVLAESALRDLVDKRGLANKHADFAELVVDKNVKEAVLKDLLASGKGAGLHGIELISGVVLAYEPWTPENVFPTRVC
jgi:long-chain acyl-CoA synthetase